MHGHAVSEEIAKLNSNTRQLALKKPEAAHAFADAPPTDRKGRCHEQDSAFWNDNDGPLRPRPCKRGDYGAKAKAWGHEGMEKSTLKPQFTPQITQINADFRSVAYKLRLTQKVGQ